MNTWKLIGTVAVDSGQVVICDPGYIQPEILVSENKELDFNNPKSFYEHCCHQTLKKEGYGKVNLVHGVASSSGNGDGVYPVYAKVDTNGVIEELKISFK
jgi:hypothetical protein